MESNTEIRKTPMQELIEIILKTRELLSSDEKFKDYDYTLTVDAMVTLLNNSFPIEESLLSAAFDFGFLQAELGANAEVTNGSQYVKKYYSKSEDISSKV